MNSSQILNAMQPGSVLAVEQNKLAQPMQNQTLTSALRGPNLIGDTYTVKRHPWVAVEVDCVGNGFVFRTHAVTLIAKDLEELQQHFTAQVAEALLNASK